MRKSPWFLPVLSAIAIGAAHADEPTATADADDVAPIDNVLVIGERREPGNMIVTGDDLALRQASSLEDIFADESSVAVGGGSSTAQKIYVRGFEDVMLNVTIDGAQSPGELYHHQARVQLEPEFIRAIELDAGAGVATNGSGALTGALRATLVTADDMLRDGQDLGAMMKAGGIYNGDDGSRYSAAAYGRLGENTGLILAVTKEDRDEYEDGNGTLQEATPFEHLHAFAKLDGGTGAHEYSVTLESLADDATTYERPNLTNFSGAYQLSDQEMNRETGVVNYAYRPGSDAVDLAVTVFANTTDFRVQRLNADIIYGEGDFDSTGFDVRNTSVAGAHALTYGLDFRADELNSAQNATPPFAWGDTRQEAQVVGAYVQDNWTLTDRVAVTVGLRYDDYTLEGTGGVSEGVDISDDGLSPNIGVSWEAVDGLTFSATWAQAFRGVAIREAFFSGLYVHDGSLESETADNAELSVAWERGPLHVAATVYRQNIENFIDTEYVGGAVWGYWRNIGDAEVEGYELEVGFETETYRATAGVWEADNSLDGEPLADSNMGLGTSIGRTWLGKYTYFGARNFTAGTQMRYVEAEPNSVAPSAPAKGSYFVADAYVDWSPTDAFTLALAVNNLTDEFYYDHATYTWLGGNANTYVGYPAVGREVVASLAYRF